MSHRDWLLLWAGATAITIFYLLVFLAHSEITYRLRKRRRAS